MGKGIELIGKVKEAWIPSSVFGRDTRSAGCANGQVKSFASGGGTVGAVALLVVADMRTGQHVKLVDTDWLLETLQKSRALGHSTRRRAGFYLNYELLMVLFAMRFNLTWLLRFFLGKVREEPPPTSRESQASTTATHLHTSPLPA